MSSHDQQPDNASRDKDFVVGVLGNPNCGKTTLFNALTGARQRTEGITVLRVAKSTWSIFQVFILLIPVIHRSTR